MPSISLRAYNREIEAMIEHGQCDEAIAHCMHILHSFPKYIGAYRLLGKALLELRRYADAADIFNRVLSSVPDDFVANIGMSIIRESEKNLNLAIWHMERAFESQPSNGVVQGELRRLYGRRDGFDPLKVRMTRGALARMYAKGSLYRQAIGELRAALSEDAQRPDLQILLAAMYYQSGQEVEAVNACNVVLRKSPYCLEANRIMAMILPKTERKDDARAYLQRIISLDPYFGKLRAGDFDVANAPDDAIQIEKLSSQASQKMLQASSQPDWVASLGVAFDAPTTNQALPDWLTGEQNKVENIPQIQEKEEPAAEALEAAELPDWLNMPSPGAAEQQPAELKDQNDAEIPDFLKDLGWEASHGKSDSDESVFTEDTEEAEKGVVPDWLQSMVSEQDAKLAETGETPPWLNEKQPGESDTIINWLGSKPVESTLVDRQSLEEALKQAPPANQPAEEIPTASEEINLPDWLKDSGTETAAAPAEDVPDWLKGLDKNETQSPTSDLSASETIIAAPWIEQQPAGEPAAHEPAAHESGAHESGAHESGAHESGADLQAIGGQASEDIPDWLKGLDKEDDTEPQFTIGLPGWAAEQAQPAANDVLSETLIAAPGAEAQPAEDIPDWLKGLSSQQDTEPQQAVPTVELPTWELEQTPAAANEAVSETMAAPVEAEAQLSETSLTEAQPAEAIPDWLKSLEIEDDTKPQQAVPSAELPAWEMEQTPAAANEAISETMAAPVEAEAQPADDIPDWLKGLGMDDTEPQPAAAELPGWEPEQAPAPSEDVSLPGWMTDQPQTPVNEDFSQTLIALPGSDVQSVEAQSGDAQPAGAMPVEDIPDWLIGLGMDDTEPQPAASELPGWEPEQAQPASEAVDLPAWDFEQSLPAANDSASETIFASPAASEQPDEALPLEALPADDLPDWLKNLSAEEETETPQAVPAAELPAWEFEQNQPVETEADPQTIIASIQAEDQPIEAQPAESIPDWLQGLAAEEDTQPTIIASQAPTPQQEPAAPVETEPVSALAAFNIDDPDAAMAWLESLAANQGVAQDQLTTRPEDRPETPEWLVEAGAQASERGELSAYVPTETTQPLPEQKPEPVSLAAPEEPMPETTTAAIAAEAEPASDLPDWLRELEAEKSTGQTDEPAAGIAGWDIEPEQPALGTVEEIQPAEATQPETLAGLEKAAQPADDVPSWLKELQAETAVEEPAAAPAEETAPVGETEPVSAVSGFNFDDPDAAMAWLESLAANQGVAQDQLTTRPEDRPETPEWLVEAGAQASERGELSTYVPTETTQPQTPEQVVVPSETIETPAETTEPEPAWLKMVETEPPGDEDTKPVRLKAAEPVVEAPSEDLAEIPDWLKSEEIEPIEPAFEAAMELPVEPADVQEVEQTAEELEIPDWMQPAESPLEKLDLNQVTLRELENLPGVGFVLASTILTQREVNGDYQYIEDLANVPGMDDQLFSILTEYLEVKSSPARQAVISEPSPVPQIGDAGVLEEAFLDIDQGKDEAGAAKLNGLIQRQVSLPEIIRGLQEAYAKNAHSVFLLQALGDAYMQDNQLQKALDSYIAAEQLLR